MSEIWRLCPGFSKYEVSDFGRVRRVVTGARGRYGNGSLRTPYAGEYGHLFLAMDSDGDRRITVPVGQLVLIAFVGEAPTSKHEAAHWDGDPANNKVGNLRWATHGENEMDKVRHGTSNRGERHHQSKLCATQVLEIRIRFAAGESRPDLAAEFGVHRSAVAAIIRGRSWAWLGADGVSL